MIINSAKCKAISKLKTKVITIRKYQFVENLCNDLYQITPSIGIFIFKKTKFESHVLKYLPKNNQPTV